MADGYSEDTLVEQPAIALFEMLEWDTVNCFHEHFGPPGSFGRPPEVDLFGASSEHYEPGSEHYAKISAIAEQVCEKPKVAQILMETVILELCANDYIPLRTLAALLKREPDSIRNHYVIPMVKRGLLEPRYPAHPNHPQQGYRTVNK